MSTELVWLAEGLDAAAARELARCWRSADLLDGSARHPKKLLRTHCGQPRFGL
jgi:hypothetical protein